MPLLTVLSSSITVRYKFCRSLEIEHLDTGDGSEPSCEALIEHKAIGGAHTFVRRRVLNLDHFISQKHIATKTRVTPSELRIGNMKTGFQRRMMKTTLSYMYTVYMKLTTMLRVELDN